MAGDLEGDLEGDLAVHLATICDLRHRFVIRREPAGHVAFGGKF